MDKGVSDRRLSIDGDYMELNESDGIHRAVWISTIVCYSVPLADRQIISHQMHGHSLAAN